jgi:hypothetical protein
VGPVLLVLGYALMYSCYLLTEADREQLLAAFPPEFPDLIAHHITYEFGVSKNSPPPPAAESVMVVGRAIDPVMGVEALVVEIDGTTLRPDGRAYHITWSLDREQGARPAHSNALIEEFGYMRVPPVRISPVPQVL